MFIYTPLARLRERGGFINWLPAQGLTAHSVDGVVPSVAFAQFGEYAASTLMLALDSGKAKRPVLHPSRFLAAAICIVYEDLTFICKVSRMTNLQIQHMPLPSRVEDDYLRLEEFLTVSTLNGRTYQWFG